jgi:large subunit ribosomal protein L3
VVVQRREKGRDGYEAVQLGLVEAVKVKPRGRALEGHFKKAGVPPTRRVKEFRLIAGGDDPAVGGKVLVSMFKTNDRVDIVGTSKGKGFQGVMKRHHFRGGAASHGGRMGGDRVTAKNLTVVRVDEDNNLLVVRGAVPGATGAYLTVRRSRAPVRIPIVQAPKKSGKKKD